jgi:hypothetical protein
MHSHLLIEMYSDQKPQIIFNLKFQTTYMVVSRNITNIQYNPEEDRIWTKLSQSANFYLDNGP